MTIEITKPELADLIQRRVANGQDVEEVLLEALHPSDCKSFPLSGGHPPKTLEEAVASMREAQKGNRLPPGITIKDLLEEGRA